MDSLKCAEKRVLLYSFLFETLGFLIEFAIISVDNEHPPYLSVVPTSQIVRDFI